ncbi:MAG TPA: adenylate/guanylate cyclase domain-containing protein [Caulobacteraceae bacterium]|nr:adenylate/guanylate cyclase domain-containing protein [Caulobacteraceae bacterium]
MAEDGRRRLSSLWRRPPNWLVTAVPGLVVTLMLLALHVAQVGVLVQLGNLLFDTYQRAEPREYQDVPVRVVDIDEETLVRLGQWPWPRTDVARLTQALTDAGASAVAFDIVFSEPDRTSPARAVEILRRNPQATGSYADIAALPDHDVLMGQTMAATPSVMGFFLTRDANNARPPAKAGFATSGAAPNESLPHFTGAILPLPAIVEGSAGTGFVSIVGGRDGIVRTAPLLADLDGEMVPSLSLEALRVAQGAGAIMVKGTDGSGEMGGGEPGVVAIKVGAFEVPTTPAGELWMYYTAPRPERIVPAWKVLTGELPQAEMERLFAGHIVFIGTGAAGLRDLVSTPVRERELGVVVHAQAVEQMILGEFLVRPDWGAGVERFALLLTGILLSLTLPWLGALRGGVAAVIALGSVVAGSWVAFQNGLLVDPTVPSLGLVGVYIAGTAFSFYREERARAYIRNAFDRYLSPELVERIARDPSQLQLGGEERDMTVMFCDIRSFSRISEKLSPQQIIGFLIEFLTPMTELLLSRKATIDKYIGDAILAFWNAPLDDPDHERNAAYATLEMVQRLKQLNAANIGAADKVWPGEVKIGIGLSTGPCCVGNMGSTQRLNYSLIGDTVNLASRIEGMTKVYGVPIMMGETLARRLDDFAVIELDVVRVVGRDAPERLFALMGPPEMAQSVDFRELAGRQALMLAAYRAQDWDGAEAALETLHGPFGLDSVAKLYAGRIAAYRKSPPGKDWDGVFEATEK